MKKSYKITDDGLLIKLIRKQTRAFGADHSSGIIPDVITDEFRAGQIDPMNVLSIGGNFD
jgi:hypothetical protein